MSDPQKQSWRLLIDSEPKDHLTNMAIDEALLSRSSDFKPTLRFYQWKDRSFSIGYFQKVKDIVAEFNCDKEKINVVRRVTGGGLVSHGNDLTMSLVVKENSNLIPNGITESYKFIHALLMKSVSSFIPQLAVSDSDKKLHPRSTRMCFEEPTSFDLTLDEKKVIGSSQRRKLGVLLHQTAIFLDVEKDKLIKSVVKTFGEELGVDFNRSDLSSEEVSEANNLVQNKYQRPENSFSC